jgi:hypothetical protein
VTTAKLQNAAVTDAKLANNAVTTSKINAEAVTTGKLGNESVTGAKLSASILGQLVKNVSYASGVSESNADDVPKSATATCPTGKQVTGGGGLIKGEDIAYVAIVESAPVVSPDGKRSAWRATAREVNPEATPWAVEAYAICAEF